MNSTDLEYFENFMKEIKALDLGVCTKYPPMRKLRYIQELALLTAECRLLLHYRIEPTNISLYVLV